MPDVFIIGVTKCATTSLYDMLMQHPDVHKQYHKEPHYHFAKYTGLKFDGEADEDSVKQMFVHNKTEYDKLYESEKLTIDGSAMTIESENALLEISRDYPNSKIILCIRNPVERAFSAFSHMKRDVRENLSFREALKQELEGSRDNYLPIWHYYRCGCYVDKIRFCRKLFGEKLLIIRFEDLISSQKATMDRVTGFLGLKHIDYKSEISNKSGNPRSKTLQKAIMRKSLAKSVFVFLIPKYIRRKLKSVIMQKNVAVKERLHEHDRYYLIELYKSELYKLSNNEDDKLLKKIYEL